MVRFFPFRTLTWKWLADVTWGLGLRDMWLDVSLGYIRTLNVVLMFLSVLLLTTLRVLTLILLEGRKRIPIAFWSLRWPVVRTPVVASSTVTRPLRL